MQSSLPPRIGRYEVVDRLGAGGMGIVYLARDPVLRRTVAIKVLPGQDDHLRERFAREARSAAALRHNNVVTIYDVGEDDGTPFIAMEFLDGESMAEMIRRRAPLAVERRLQLMLELCAGLGYAHRNGIIHRDIKPGNLMITTEGSLKILDFGLARVTSDITHTGLTRAGSVMGTPHYMSPEQVEGKPVDSRSDIFSVGIVLYELLTYRKAYPGEGAHVVLHNIIHTAPTPIRDVLPTIDPELERIVGKGIEKDPARRYQDLASLATELERVRARLADGSDDETLTEERVTAPSHTRRRFWLIAGSALVATSVVLTVRFGMDVQSAQRPSPGTPANLSQEPPSQGDPPPADTPRPSSAGPTSADGMAKEESRATGPRVATRLAAASQAFEEGDYAGAVSAYEGLLKEDPGNVAAANGLAAVRRAQLAESRVLKGSASAARPSADGARQLSAHVTNGQQLYSNGDYDAAISAFGAALRIDPKNAAATAGVAAAQKAKAAEEAVLRGRLKKPTL